MLTESKFFFKHWFQTEGVMALCQLEDAGFWA
jgi:hypothetical protein